MVPTIQTLVLLLVVIVAVSVLAKRLNVAPPILLVLAGVVLALIPGLPAIALAPELVLLLVLPPVIYWSAVTMSWKEFRFNLRPIASAAVGGVLFTTVAVAAITHWLLHFPWAVGFVLGAIVSPPDPVAPLSIAKGLFLPRRLAVILEGEGLANDATALVIYRFAIMAVSAGAFSLHTAAIEFVVILVGEILWGIGVASMMLRLRRWIGEPRIELVLSVLTAFLAYWPPQYLGGSGVLATVTAGLYVSWNGQRLIPSATRLQGSFFWDFLLYLINGMVFLITGLQTRQLIREIHGHTASEIATSAIVVCIAVIAARFIWTFPSVYLPVWLFPAIAREDPAPNWRRPFLVSFTGVRGIVSLAAALAVPFTTDSGAPFPNRGLILLLTFCVILVTLVGQGLMLPTVIRALGLDHVGHRERRTARLEEFAAREAAIRSAQSRLGELAKERGLPNEIADEFDASLKDRLRRLKHRSGSESEQRRMSEIRDDIDLQLIATERQIANELYRNGKLKDEERRRIEHDLDLREAHVANVRAEDA